MLGGEIGGDGLEPGERIDNREARDAGDVARADLDRERLGLEARAVADFARGGALVFGELLAHPRAFGLREHAAVEVADDALERLLHVVGFAAVDEGERDGLAAGAVKDDELAPRRANPPTRYRG